MVPLLFYRSKVESELKLLATHSVAPAMPIDRHSVLGLEQPHAVSLHHMLNQHVYITAYDQLMAAR